MFETEARNLLSMKTCPYCAEEIQDAAIKCRWCGEFLDDGVNSNVHIAPRTLAAEDIAALRAPGSDVSKIQRICNKRQYREELVKSLVEIAEYYSKHYPGLTLALYLAASYYGANADLAIVRLKSQGAEEDLDFLQALKRDIPEPMDAPLTPAKNKPSSALEYKASELICTSCGVVGKPKTVVKGSFVFEIALWLMFLLPGILYSLWRSTSRKKVCRHCGGENMIPVNSPMGRKIRGV